MTRLSESDPEVAYISVGPRHNAIVDRADLELLRSFAWHVNRVGYARMEFARDGARYRLSMSHLLMNPPDGLVVDHINGNKLDNRRSNLRVCTRAQNSANIPRPGIKGVESMMDGKFHAKFRNKHLGTYSTKRDAAIAYDDAALAFYGEFARLNYPRTSPDGSLIEGTRVAARREVAELRRLQTAYRDADYGANKTVTVNMTDLLVALQELDRLGIIDLDLSQTTIGGE